jgi:opacity protein-like surface antigen
MNAVKIALLGTAALAAVSVSARADDLSDLKAQIEALNGRISQLESSPSVPAGYQLLSISQADAIIVPGLNSEKDKFYGKKAHNIGVMPTADVPASTIVQWTGFVRAGIVYKSGKSRIDRQAIDALPAQVGPPAVAAVPAGTTVIGGVKPSAKSKSLDVVSRAGIKVIGTTDTAVGEVGVRIALLASVEAIGGTNRSHDSAVATDGYWGWWKITPELTLGGGVDGSLANSSNAFDNRCACAYIDTGGAFGHDDPTQIRLSYASGPISFAVAVEDEANSGTKSALGFAGEMKYSGDTIGFDINAGYWDSKSSALATSDAAWTVNAGANMALGDIANLGVAIGVGEDKHLAGNFDSYAKASVFLGFTLSDAVSAELGGAYTDYKGNSNSYTIGGGLYYTPVSQLTLGLEASYSKSKNVATNEAGPPVEVHRTSGNQAVVDAIAVWRF